MNQVDSTVEFEWRIDLENGHGSILYWYWKKSSLAKINESILGTDIIRYEHKNKLTIK